MLSFNRIGDAGLGNQMFRFTAIKGLARNLGYNFCISTHNRLKLAFDLVGIDFKNILQPCLIERQFHFDELLFSRCPDNVDLYGYFQTEKYFQNILSEVEQDFTFRKEILSKCQEVIKPLGDAVALHVRRGDYLKLPEHHPICDMFYYDQALRMVDDSIPVIVFSDDSTWCRNHFIGDRFHFVSTDQSCKLDKTILMENELDSLCLMSLCKEFIIANSSYSWWGAWLSKSNTVIAPKKWFGAALQNHQLHDLIPESWVIL